jgi:hypothetical protein
MKSRPLLATLLLLSLLGCSKLTMDNYMQIKVGMTYDEVVKLIGKPENCDDLLGLRNCSWSHASSSVKVSFAGDKVLLFSSSNLK